MESWASDEAALFWAKIASSMSRLLATLDGLSAAQLNWRPPAPGANSLAALATHVLANLEENIAGVVLGHTILRAREDEFANPQRDLQALEQRWSEIRQRCEAGLRQLPATEVAVLRDHPRRGRITVREVLLVVARHVEEHKAHAELTRDLLLATRPAG
jgi:uncharacterized damage-inducible protein DinB